MAVGTTIMLLLIIYVKMCTVYIYLNHDISDGIFTNLHLSDTILISFSVSERIVGIDKENKHDVRVHFIKWMPLCFVWIQIKGVVNVNPRSTMQTTGHLHTTLGSPSLMELLLVIRCMAKSMHLRIWLIPLWTTRWVMVFRILSI